MAEESRDDTRPDRTTDTGRPPPKDERGQAGEGGPDEGGAAPPSAGPHADPDLTDADKTPGAGTLPPVGGPPDQDSNAG